MYAYTCMYIHSTNVSVSICSELISVCSDIEPKAVWLTKGDPAHNALMKVLTAGRRLQTLRLLNHGMHTGALENLHSLILAYAPKRLDFDPPGYAARVQLAIIDHNRYTARPKAKGSFYVCLLCLFH